MIVITAPTGNVGAEVVRILVERVQVQPFRVAARHPEVLRSLYGQRLQYARLDFDDPSTWSGALDGVSTLFLVCPQPSPRVVNTQILPFVETAIKMGCQHIIFLSVPGADRITLLPHARIEQYIEASGVPYTFLRPSYFMQNFIRKAPTHGVDIATGHEIFLPVGKGRLSMIDARDVARIVVTICDGPKEYKNQAYYLTGSEAPNMFQVAAVFSHVLGQSIRYTHPSLPSFLYRLRRRGVPWSLLLVMSIEYTVAGLGMSAQTNDVVMQLTGRPPITLAQFIEDNKYRWLTEDWV